MNPEIDVEHIARTRRPQSQRPESERFVTAVYCVVMLM